MMKLHSLYYKTNEQVNSYIDVVIHDGENYYDVGYGEINTVEKMNIKDYTLLLEFEKLKKIQKTDYIELLDVKTAADSDMFLKLMGNHFITITFEHSHNSNESSQFLNVISNQDVDKEFLSYYNSI